MPRNADESSVPLRIPHSSLGIYRCPDVHWEEDTQAQGRDMDVHGKIPSASSNSYNAA
jgi:hypothetical protein